VIGTHNNFWLWGTGELDGSVLIVVAAPKAPVLAHFASCRVASRVDCPHCEPWLRERALFVCEEPEKPLAELWAGLKRFE
jgi:hypothetical protein